MSDFPPQDWGPGDWCPSSYSQFWYPSAYPYSFGPYASGNRSPPSIHGGHSENRRPCKFIIIIYFELGTKPFISVGNLLLTRLGHGREGRLVHACTCTRQGRSL